MRRILLFTAYFILLIPTITSSQSYSGKEIIEKVNELLNPEASYGKASMTILTTSGDVRTFIYEQWSKGKGEKNLVRYIKPVRVKDQAILMLNNADDIWSYFPRTRRIRKLATHAKKQKMQGSDFSYEDMGSGDTFLDDYSAKRLEDEVKQGYECYKVELNRNVDSDASYSRIVIWIIKENFYPICLNYYHENDETFLEKVLVQSEIRIIDGIPTAMKSVMNNKKDNTRTQIELINIKYNIDLKDDLFTERSLKK